MVDVVDVLVLVLDVLVLDVVGCVLDVDDRWSCAGRRLRQAVDPCLSQGETDAGGRDDEGGHHACRDPGGSMCVSCCFDAARAGNLASQFCNGGGKDSGPGCVQPRVWAPRCNSDCRWFAAAAPQTAGEVDELVVARARRGDQDAFARIVGHYDHRLRALAFRLLGDRDRMDDVLQEVYVKAFRSLPRFKGDVGPGHVAVPHHLQRLHGRAAPAAGAVEPRLRRNIVDPGSGPADIAVRRQDLAAALDRLPPDQRTAVLLVDAYGLDYADAAEVLGVRAGTIGSRLSRARAVLRAALGGATSDDATATSAWAPSCAASTCPTTGRSSSPCWQQRLAQEAPARRRRPGGGDRRCSALAAAAVLVSRGRRQRPADRRRGTPFRPSPVRHPPHQRRRGADRVSTALASLRSLSGEVAIECAVPRGDCFPPDAGGRTTLRWSFVTTAAGDERITGIGHQDDVAYSAARREQRARTEAGRRRRSSPTCRPGRRTRPPARRCCGATSPRWSGPS